MKILKLSSYCYPEQVSSSHLTRDLNEAYEKAGIVCEIHTPTPTRGIDEETRKKYKKIKYEELNNGHIQIHRFGMFKEPKNSLLRAFRYTLCIIINFFNGLGAKDIDVYYASSTPPINGLIMALLKKFKKFKIVYNLQDIFPDSLVNTGMTKKGSLIWKIGAWVERVTYKAADKIIVISNSMKQNILNKGVPEEKIEVISNWIDADAVKPVPREDNKLFEEYNIPKDKFIVVYAGNMGAAQGTEVILDTAEKLKDNTDIQFVVFGGGSGFETVKKKVEEKNLSNVIINSLLPQDRVPEVYSLGDVAIITCKKGSGTSAMPSKTWSIMACDTPIVASFDTDSELSAILKEANAGVAVEPGDADELCKEILAISSNPDTKYDGGRKYVLENASKDVCTGKYIEVLKECFK